jgi:thioredoxin 2
VVRDVAGELAGQAVVVQIDTQENPALASRFAIQGIPALLLLKKGRVVARISGSRSKKVIIDWFRNSGP